MDCSRKLKYITTSQKNPWKSFIAGVLIGIIIAWGIFLFIYGTYQDKQLRILIQQQETIQQLEIEKNILIDDKQKLNDETKENLVIQDIQVSIINAKQMKLDALLQEQLTNVMLEDLHDLLTQPVESVSNNHSILKKLIENKNYKVDDNSYAFHVETIYFDTILDIQVSIRRNN